jgi:hypothetical protein
MRRATSRTYTFSPPPSPAPGWSSGDVCTLISPTRATDGTSAAPSAPPVSVDAAVAHRRTSVRCGARGRPHRSGTCRARRRAAGRRSCSPRRRRARSAPRSAPCRARARRASGRTTSCRAPTSCVRIGSAASTSDTVIAAFSSPMSSRCTRSVPSAAYSSASVRNQRCISGRRKNAAFSSSPDADLREEVLDALRVSDGAYVWTSNGPASRASLRALRTSSWRIRPGRRERYRRARRSGRRRGRPPRRRPR